MKEEETFFEEDEMKSLDKEKLEEDLKYKKKVRNRLIIKSILVLILLFIVIIAADVIYNASLSMSKPIIYVYPEEETQISVQLGNPECVTCSYPKYTTGWQVLARPNGDLTDLLTGKNLYSLYYESDSVTKFEMTKEGFVVKGEDTAEFLEEKLYVLGLTERESEEFIIYWLPKLESNRYNYIRFASLEEINENMPLEITPKPDMMIRVLMEYKGLKKPVEVEEQKLETPERTGFVVVEWGGTEIK